MKNKLLLTRLPWYVYLFIFATFLFGCATLPDPIDRLVADASASHFWLSGAFPLLGLPETASPEQVIKRIFEKWDFDKKGFVTSYRILKIRQVHIRGSLPDLYTAALVQTNFGKKIVLFRYGGYEWWSRVCDAKDD